MRRDRAHTGRMLDQLCGSTWVDPAKGDLYVLTDNGYTYLHAAPDSIWEDRQTVLARLVPYVLPQLPKQIARDSAADYLAVAKHYAEIARHDPDVSPAEVSRAFSDIARTLAIISSTLQRVGRSVAHSHGL